MEGIMVLVVMLLGFILVGVLGAMKAKKGPKIPDGHRLDASFGGSKAIVIVDKKLPGFSNKEFVESGGWIIEDTKISIRELTKRCAIAMYAVKSAFKEKGLKKTDESVIVFKFSTDETFEEGHSWWKAWAKGATAYSTELSGIFRTNKTPMAVIRTKHLATTFQKGQPVLHELVHILCKGVNNDYSHDHTDHRLWIKSGGIDSIEGTAVRQWADLVEAFNADEEIFN
jgi:hypothetical protein